MSAWQALTWDIARAGGFTAYLLVTASVVLGLVLSMRWQARWWPRLVSYELHIWITILSFVFLVIHMLASWLDPFTRFGLNELLLPFASHYRPLWMAFGIVAAYLALAVTLSLFIRQRIGYLWWRRLHQLSFAVWALAIIHGLATGSDTRTPWGIEIYMVSAVVVCALLCARLMQSVGPGERAHPLWAGAVAGALAVAIIWAATGPLRPGWNAIANNHNGTGGIAQAAGSATPTATPTAPFGQPFTSSAQGVVSTQTDANTGQPIVQLDLTLAGSQQGVLQIQLWQQINGGGNGRGEGDNEDGDHGDHGKNGSKNGNGSVSVTTSQVTLGANAATPLYQGQLSTLNGGSMVARLDATQPGQPALQLTINVQVQGNTVSGTVSGTPLVFVP
jgi:DMSO/TMAO reductase YedYZ heme-binding membrane subunit